MENSAPECCQTCFRPLADASSPQVTQWITVCRCDRPYAPNSQFFIAVCADCKKRVAANANGKSPDLCCCAAPNPVKVPTHLKQGEREPVTLDLTTIGMSQDNFPLDKYIPIGILGEGPRANVVLARDKQRGTKVAVKCFKRVGLQLKPTFESEARKNKQLTHANIAKLIDFGFHNGNAPYTVSEYKDAFNLDQYLSLFGTPSYDVAVKVLIGICETLIYAQKQSIFHRNLRPSNVLFVDDMNSDPSISITDFAFPKVQESEGLTHARDAMYMSGDVARNMEFTEKSEVYTIGSVGYALLTGRPQFLETNPSELKNLHALKLQPRISDIKFDNNRPKDLDEVVERCLEKDPSYRFESVAKLMERLEVFPRRHQMKIDAVASAKKKAKMMRIAIAGVVVAALCAVGYFAFLPH